MFGMNMPFMSSSEVKNAYFMSGKANQFSILFHELNFEFSFYYIQF